MTPARLGRNHRPKLRGPARWICATALWSAFALPALAQPIYLLTESYAPFGYEEDGALKGISVELLKAVMADAGIAYDMKIQPWARAYGMALNTPGHCVFSTVHTPERDQLFEWVEPLYTTEAYLVRKTGSQANPANIDDAKRYLVGTQLSDYTADLLKQGGFTRIDLTSEIDLTVKKLLAGRIDLMPMSASSLAGLQRQGLPLEASVVFNTSLGALACNRQTDPNILTRLRASLKKLIADGTRAGIFQRYKFVEGGLLR